MGRDHLIGYLKELETDSEKFCTELEMGGGCVSGGSFLPQSKIYKENGGGGGAIFQCFIAFLNCDPT